MNYQRFTLKNLSVNISIVTVYLILTYITDGIRTDHVLVLTIWVVMYYTNKLTRKIITGFSIFIIYWIVYDSMRIIPNYEVSTVHIKELYEAEKLLFGINLGQLKVTPNEFFKLYNYKFLDLISGLFYLTWVPVPLAFAVYLFVKDKATFIQFSLVFLFVNLLGFVIYYIYPAAPPWYVDMYGFDLKIGVPGNRAGLVRFDELIGIPVFANIYNKNANVLAAIPSLHSAYPVIVLYYGIKKHLGWVNLVFAILMIGIWFAAVYSGHHYIIDVILGPGLAILTIILFENLMKTTSFKRQIMKFNGSIE